VTAYHCGYAAIIGRPNVGKSTLLNRLVGQKVSIVSRRQQTTRHRILGIHTDDNTQAIYVDTPGLHGAEGSAMRRVMNRTASASAAGVDVVVLVITARGWTEDDERPLRVARTAECPVVLAINKIDRVDDKRQLLSLIAGAPKRAAFADVVPVCAASGDNVGALAAAVARHFPERPALFPEDQLSDRTDRFFAAEFMREQIFRSLGAEVPHASAVEVTSFTEDPRLARIQIVIWVERPGHKAIVIGQGGERLREMGRRARLEMERAFGKKVFLETHVKVRKGWSDDLRALRSLGYAGDG
jgi:GTP-binding protein Era